MSSNPLLRPAFIAGATTVAALSYVAYTAYGVLCEEEENLIDIQRHIPEATNTEHTNTPPGQAKQIEPNRVTVAKINAPSLEQTKRVAAAIEALRPMELLAFVPELGTMQTAQDEDFMNKFHELCSKLSDQGWAIETHLTQLIKNKDRADAPLTKHQVEKLKEIWTRYSQALGSIDGLAQQIPCLCNRLVSFTMLTQLCAANIALHDEVKTFHALHPEVAPPA